MRILLPRLVLAVHRKYYSTGWSARTVCSACVKTAGLARNVNLSVTTSAPHVAVAQKVLPDEVALFSFSTNGGTRIGPLLLQLLELLLRPL